MTDPAGAIDVVFSADRSYIPHLCTAVTSLLETNRSSVDKVWVITDAAESGDFRRFRDHIRDRYGVAPIPLQVQADSFSGLYVSGHVSWATYARFLLGDLLPRTVSRALYLDSDLIVVGSLDDLLEGHAASGGFHDVVRAVSRDSGHHLEPFGFSSDVYFNAGVLLVDLEKWRNDCIGNQLFAVAVKLFGKLHLWDQDVLNLVLEHRWSKLPGKFNETALTAMSDDARIVHFVGGTKPWMFGSKHPYRDKYRRYRSLTPFWPYLPEGLAKFLRKRLIPRPLQRPGRSFRRLTRKMRRLVGRLLTTG